MDKKILKKTKKCLGLDCNNLIARYSLRCQTCAAIERNKDKEYLKKQSLAQKGQKRSDEAKQKMSKAQKERFKNPQNHPRLGKGLIGENNGRYIDGRTPVIISLRHSKEYNLWRDLVFKKDSYTCQECNQVGGNLEAHHIKAFSLIFNDFINQYSQFSLIEDKETLLRLAMTYELFWNIDNGITLCENCHKLNYTTRPKI